MLASTLNVNVLPLTVYVPDIPRVPWTVAVLAAVASELRSPWSSQEVCKASISIENDMSLRARAKGLRLLAIGTSGLDRYPGPGAGEILGRLRSRDRRPTERSA